MTLNLVSGLAKQRGSQQQQLDSSSWGVSSCWLSCADQHLLMAKPRLLPSTLTADNRWSSDLNQFKLSMQQPPERQLVCFSVGQHS